MLCTFPPSAWQELISLHPIPLKIPLPIMSAKEPGNNLGSSVCRGHDSQRELVLDHCHLLVSCNHLLYPIVWP